MRFRSRFVFVVSAAVMMLGLTGIWAVPALSKEGDASKRARLSQVDRDMELYEFYSAQMQQGVQLTEPEKETYLDLESRLSDDRDDRNTLDNQGGPDAFSYFFMDNQPPDTATYDWIELRDDPGATWIGGYTHFTSPDDGYSRQKAPIGFAFPFYGATYDCVRVMCNGLLNFTNTSQSLTNACLPASSVNAPIIAMLWDDLHQTYGGRPDTLVVGYKNFGEYFVLEFDGIGHCCTAGASFTFEAILYPNGNIKLQYNNLVFSSWPQTQTIGIQQAGAAGSAALNYVCNTTGFQPQNDLAIWFFRPNGIPLPCTNLAANVVGTDVTLTWTDPTLDTQGNPITITNVEVWLGAAGTGTLVSTVTGGTQFFTHVNAPTGNLTYTIRPFNDPYYGTPTSIPVVVGTPGYTTNFDSDNGQWVPTPATGGWEWGIPWGIAGLIPHSQPNVWGTVVAGNYTDNACWQLDLNLGLVVTSDAATVEFWQWFYSQASYDGCNFKVSVDNGATWTVLTPTQGLYSTTALLTTTCMTGQPAWAGTTPHAWQFCVIPIGQFVGQVPIFRFEFSSNASTSTYPGFYFDDMQIWGVAGQQAGIPQPCTNLAGNYVAPNLVLTWTDPLLDTQGNPLLVDSVQIWLGAAGTGTRLGSVGPGVQTFTHLNAPVGFQTYTIRPCNDSFYGAPIAVYIPLGNPPYVSDFNTDEGGWTTPPEDGWAWGVPSNPAAPAPHSGPSYWGTGLAANYTADACWQLDLNEELVVISPTATVEFWYVYDSQLSYDGCNFKASTDNGASWTVLTPSQGAYNSAALNVANTCMSGQPAWSNTTPRIWQYAIFPVGQYMGQALLFRFEFGSNPTTFYTGFFFDDMLMWGVAPAVGVPRPCTNLAGTYTAPNVQLTWTDPTLDTDGNPLVVDSVQIWLGPVGTGTRLGSVSAGVQTFAHFNAPVGIQTYTVRPCNDSYYGTPVSVNVTVGNPAYVNDFEQNDGQWVADPTAGGWEWGTPTLPAGLVPHSGTHVWGTLLNANYPNSACWTLTLSLNLMVQSPTATVEFWRWWQTEQSFDGVNFKVSVDGGATWTLVQPVGNYPWTASTANVCIPAEPYWAGTATTWAYTVLPIGQFMGQTPIFRFTFGSDPSVQYPGFFFDDMIIWGLQPPVGVPRPCTNLAASYVAPNVVLTWTDPNQDMTGLPLTPDSIQIWLGTIASGQRIGAVGAGAQTFTHLNAPSGQATYTVRAFAGGFASSPVSVPVTVGNPSYVSDFELDNGGWVPDPATGGWEWGTPTLPAGLVAHSGTNVWGTVLNADYPNSACFRLTLDLDLVVRSPTATVEFWRWLQTEQSFDGVNFKVSVDGGTTWTLVQPVGNYPYTASTANVCIPSEPYWAGTGTTWTYTVLPIGQFLDQTPMFRFTFGSDGSVVYPGFFFDDMIIWGLGPASSITGTVRSFGQNQPIEGARVWASDWPDTAITDASGYYDLGIDPGTYSVTFDHAHFCDSTHVNVVVEDGGQTTRDAILRRPVALISVTSISMLGWLGEVTLDSFTISNTGGQCPLDFSISDTSDWLTASPDSGSVNPNESVTIIVQADAPPVAGDYVSALLLVYNAVGTPTTIRVDATFADNLDDPNAIPTEFAYYQNYPNPFNAQTSLRFDVPQQSRVQITIYNIMGQQVVRPVDKVYAPGRYRVLYDARDLPSGMYLVKMSASGFERIGKMMLLK